MIRSFPDFGKLNCSHHQRTGILAVDLRCSVVKYHERDTYALNTFAKPSIQFSLSCCIWEDSWERPKNVCDEQLFECLKSWNKDLELHPIFHFLMINHSLCLRSSTCIITVKLTGSMWRCPLSYYLEQIIIHHLVQFISATLKLF